MTTSLHEQLAVPRRDLEIAERTAADLRDKISVIEAKLAPPAPQPAKSLMSETPHHVIDVTEGPATRR